MLPDVGRAATCIDNAQCLLFTSRCQGDVYISPAKNRLHGYKHKAANDLNLAICTY